MSSLDLGRIYDAKVVRWVDGDTVWLDVDLGFRARLTTDFRLYGVDTPERGQDNWAEATKLVNSLAPVGTAVKILSLKDPDKYGRWLAAINVPGQSESINGALISAGLAVPYFGGKR